MTYGNERRALQGVVALAALVPILAGAIGVLTRGASFQLSGADAAQSHATYLSGLLLGIGLGFWSCVPRIQDRGARFGLLTAIVFTGGLARLVLLGLHAPAPAILFALAMELVVTPLLFLWQRRVARA